MIIYILIIASDIRYVWHYKWDAGYKIASMLWSPDTIFLLDCFHTIDSFKLRYLYCKARLYTAWFSSFWRIFAFIFQGLLIRCNAKRYYVSIWLCGHCRRQFWWRIQMSEIVNVWNSECLPHLPKSLRNKVQTVSLCRYCGTDYQVMGVGSVAVSIVADVDSSAVLLFFCQNGTKEFTCSRENTCLWLCVKHFVDINTNIPVLFIDILLKAFN